MVLRLGWPILPYHTPQKVGTLGTGLARTGTNTGTLREPRLSDSREGGEALSSVHPPAPATGKLIHNLLCDVRMKNDRDTLLLQPQPILSGQSHLIDAGQTEDDCRSFSAVAGFFAR